jgi:hypothetical protein
MNRMVIFTPVVSAEKENCPVITARAGFTGVKARLARASSWIFLSCQSIQLILRVIEVRIC